MSYRSQVAIVFDRNALTGDQRAKAEEILALLCEENYRLIKKNNEYLQFYHENYKWNDLDEDIKFFYSFLKEIPLHSYEFARTGEESGDDEFEGTGGFGLSIIHQVDPSSLPLKPY